MAWRARILNNPQAVFASVLLMKSIPSEKSGVLVTSDLTTGGAGLTVSVAWGVGGAVDNESAASRVLRADGSSLVLAEAKAPYRRVLAADVDGADNLAKFWYVTLPELRYVLGAVFLLRLIWTFNKFDDIWLLTSGGYGTNVLPVLTYQFSFKLDNFGRGAANAMILLLILAVFLVFYVLVVMRNVEEA